MKNNSDLIVAIHHKILLCRLNIKFWSAKNYPLFTQFYYFMLFALKNLDNFLKSEDLNQFNNEISNKFNELSESIKNIIRLEPSANHEDRLWLHQFQNEIEDELDTEEGYSFPEELQELLKDAGLPTNRVPVTPGTWLELEFIIPNKIDYEELAKDLNLSSEEFWNLLEGRKPFTVETCIKFARKLQCSSTVLINMQKDLDLHRSIVDQFNQTPNP